MPDRSLLMRSRLPFVLALCTTLVLFLTAQRCPNRALKRAATDLKGKLESHPDWGGIDVDNASGLRVHIYPAPPKYLLPDTEVEAYEPIPGNSPTRLECDDDVGCWLIFVDTDHYAHFAHKTVIALWKIKKKEFSKPIVASWWPLVDGQPVFNTVASREGFFLEQISTPIPEIDPSNQWGRAQWRRAGRLAPPPTPIQADPGLMDPPPTPTPTPTTCPKYAVVVNGYKDSNDTFDEDADGIYAILTGHGFPPDNIYHLSALLDAPACDTPAAASNCPSATAQDACEPAANVPGCPQETVLLQPISYCNLRRVLKEFIPSKITKNGGACDEFVFFLSTHGNEDTLILGPNLLCHIDLKEFLSGIPCDRVTVIVEACFSGGLLEHVADPPSTDPTQKRLVFTSTEKAGVSHQDVDFKPDPGWIPDKNPGDSGSETIWGYIESFGTGITDTSPDDDKISYREAIGFAIEHDVKAQNNENKPLVTPTPTPGLIAHSCINDPGAVDIGIDLKAALIPQANPAMAPVPALTIEPGQKLILPVSVADVVGTMASGTMTAATVRVYWSLVEDPEWPKDFYDHSQGNYFDRQIGHTILVTGLPSGGTEDLELGWEVDDDFDANDSVMILAVVDSPQDPLPSTPQKVVDLVNQTNNAAYLIMSVGEIGNGGCFLGCRTLR